MKRKEMGQSEEPTMSVIDSNSARTGLTHAVSGVDGSKKVKEARAMALLASVFFMTRYFV